MRGLVAAVIIGFQLFGMCCVVVLVNKPRKPITPDSAVATVVISLAFAVGVYWLWAS